ncbi:group IID secretory phospholipase A2 isoform X10 [Ovis aries]|uniref:group IID secretory phospholipase A2 isoform X10 n=1 Tax=Ovis aries TaxID=9940 RepID=UPI0005FB188E|nr:group IID secretory phospholipase A2 isoform X10 [Ovis aries]
MGLPLLCVLLVFAGVAPAEGDMLDLNKMVKQVTGKTPIFFYSSYGCYCGFGGQGQPRDATDWFLATPCGLWDLSSLTGN